METKVWKCTRNLNGVLYSAWIDNPETRIEYKVGEFVVPRVDGSFIISFASQHHATEFEKYMKGQHGYVLTVHEAVGIIPKERPMPEGWLSTSSNQTPGDIDNFWKSFDNSKLFNKLPPGTVFCSQIKLIN